MEHFGAVGFCIFVTVLCQGVNGVQYMTSRLVEPLETTPPPLIDLVTLVQRDIDYRYTDAQKLLTAIKSKKFKSCFVVDEDPRWNPNDDDLQTLMMNQKSQTINGKDEFSKLRAKAGDIIAYMCRKAQIYWLISSEPPLPPPIGMNGKPPAEKPKQEPKPDAPFAPVPAIQEIKELPKDTNVFDRTNNAFPSGMRALDGELKQNVNQNTDNFGFPVVDKPTNIIPDKFPELPKINGGGLKEPFLIQQVNKPLVDLPGGDLMVEPPRINQGTSDLLAPPPLINSGDNNLIEPPLQTGDLLQPPSLTDLLLPPPLQDGDLLEPPRFQTGGGLLQPPQLGNGDLLPPPLLNLKNNVEPPFKTPPPLAQLLGLRRVAQKWENPPPLRPILAKSKPLLKDSQQFDDQFPSLAPPLPDFSTPRLRFF